MPCAYETYLTSGGVSGRITGARAAELRRLHEEHHATTCRDRCRVCGAKDCDTPACFDTIMFRMKLEQHGAARRRAAQRAWSGAMSPADARLIGVVDFYDRFTGRGQVIGPDHRAYWLHRKELSGISELRTGQPVEFTPTETPRGPRALEVRPCEGELKR